VTMLALPAAAGAAAVPAGFFGVVPQSPISTADFSRMEGTVGNIRIFIDWRNIEPEAGAWDFSATDTLIGEAAAHGIGVVPGLYGVPAWIGGREAVAPRGSKQRRGWLRFVRRTVGRYGPGGDFWEGRAKAIPIHRWQVWNEPNFLLFWRPRPEPRRYARLLSDTARAIRRLDERAVIVAAGVAPIEGGMAPAEFMRKMYAAPGSKRSFDVAALHPYATSLASLAYQVRQARAVMASAGDATTPLQISEIGIGSGSAKESAFNKGLRGQARFLSGALGMLTDRRRRWRIAEVDWFSWRDGAQYDVHCAFCQYSGLVRFDHTPKPAWRAYVRFVRKTQLSARRPVHQP
jgi:polysaccharide biosynthesis protein PslG